MAIRDFELKRLIQSQEVSNLKKSVLGEVIVTSNDTVPIASLTSITAAVVKNATTGADVTCTVLTNVVTITNAGLTNVKVVIFAIGS